MTKIFLPVSLFVLIILCGCSKNPSGQESILYGAWIKGIQPGDTIQFFQKDGKNIMLYNLSFNPALLIPTEAEYTFSSNKLSIRQYPVTSSSTFFPIESFAWKQAGKEFEIKVNQLSPYLSYMYPPFTYRKI